METIKLQGSIILVFPTKAKLLPLVKCVIFLKLSTVIYQEYMSVFYFIYLFIYFWLRWVLVAARWLSLVAASGGYSLLRCAAFSLLWLLLLRSTGSRRADFSSCGTWAQ